MADLFDSITNWLLNQSLGDDGLEITLKGLANRLLDGGVPVARISTGRTILHPMIGLIEMQWDRDGDGISVNNVPRAAVMRPLNLDSPFNDLANGKYETILADLTDPQDVARYELFSDLAARGLTGYAAFARRFGTPQRIYETLHHDFRGCSLSFATSRFSGFSPTDLEGIERLITPLCTCIRIENDRIIAAAVLETYLGRISGKEVLAGEIGRGDGRQIDCAIFYSDLCGSLALSQVLDTQTYLDTLNAYFDCTASAVAEHGGEVLKFI